MISRRATLLAGLGAAMPRALAAAETIGVPPTGRCAFDVFRNGSHIGVHSLDFQCVGATVTVRIAIRFAVGLGPITLYRYAMDGTEHWVGGQFQALDTQTNDDGASFAVSVRRSAGGLAVRSAGEPEQTLPGTALPLTHWSIAAMTSPLFNPQTGKAIAERVVARGPGTVRLGNGASVQATEYHLAGDLPLQDWYDDSRLWVKLRAKGKDGSDIEYRRA